MGILFNLLPSQFKTEPRINDTIYNVYGDVVGSVKEIMRSITMDKIIYKCSFNDEIINPYFVKYYKKMIFMTVPIKKDSSLVVYKKQAINAARELKYGSDIIISIENADSESEIQRIMITARKEKFGE